MATTFGLNRSIGGAIAAIALVAVLAATAAFSAIGDLRQATDARMRANQAIRSVGFFQGAMLNQETGLRGFLITGRETSLEPYRMGVSALDSVIEGLRPLIADDPESLQLLGEAETAARTWQSKIGTVVIAKMSDPATRPDAVRIEASGEGKALFDTFRGKLAAIEGRAERVRDAQQERVVAAQRNATAVLWIGVGLTLLICLGIGVAINRLIVRPLVALADTMQRLVQGDLTAPIPATNSRNEVGAMARSVKVFKASLIELDRTSLLRATTDTLPAMVGYVDSERRIGFLNGEFGRWFDLKAGDVSELAGKPLAQVFPSAGFPGAERELEDAFGGAETRFEHRLDRREEGAREVEAFYRPHRGTDGRVLGVVTLLTDITERKRMEMALSQQAEDLARTNEELEQFAYVASHDLKAPLRGIDNLVTWIEEDLEGSLTGDVRTNMDLLKSRVRRLESLLDDLLAYSRAGRGDLVADTVDTKRLVDELAVLVSPPEGFRITSAPDLPTLRAARAPLTQALQNLIGNAIKHHDRRDDGHIEVAAATRGDAVEFTVIDDGPGIAPAYRERVFGMFQTLKPRDEVEGSGMGLAIVKKLVERQGGRIWLSDGRNGRGLTVHMTWPREIGGDKYGAPRKLAAGR